MKEIAIHHHLGLGDHIICNALVRHYCNLYDNVYLYVFKRNYDAVNFMYKDIKNLNYYILNDNITYDELFKEINNYKKQNIEYLEIGYNYLNNKFTSPDQLFYEQVNLPFEIRYNNFYIERDIEKENYVYNFYNPKNEPYVFLHHDSRMLINKDLILNKDLKLIEINFKLFEPKPFRIFDYMKLIENCEEGHFIDSSFKCLADSFIQKKYGMYFHLKLNKNNTSCRKYWNILFDL